jgi:hypothetical protein
VRTRLAGLTGVLLTAVLALGGCSSGDSVSEAVQPSDAPSSGPTPKDIITLPPPPERTLSGTITAELQQSSRDVALGRFQVWLTNGLDHEIDPTRIVYRDQQLSRPVLGGRLRTIPSGSYRGYPLDLIEPDCRAERAKQSVTVTFDGTSETVPVYDETGVVDRWSHQRCDEIAVESVAKLEWTRGIRVEGSGSDAVAMFRLTATPSGRGGSLTVDTVGGTPLYTSADGDFWTVGTTVRGVGKPVTMELPAQPARCDSHAFGAATGGTTFFVNLTLGSGASRRKAQIRLAMSPEVSAETFAYAREACGWEE